MANVAQIVRIFIFCMLFSLPINTFAAGHGSVPGISADVALDALREGNLRYIQGRSLTPNTDSLRRIITATDGQHPFVMVLACADSRVPVEILFDRGIGDIFVARVAGNVVSPSVLGTLEYGAEHLGIPVLVVLGHTNCGAVTAVFKGEKAHGHLAELLQPIIPAVEKAKSDAAASHSECTLDAVIMENVRQAINDIRAKSPELAAMEQSGKLRILGAVYDINTGEIVWGSRDGASHPSARRTPGETLWDLSPCAYHVAH